MNAQGIGEHFLVTDEQRREFEREAERLGLVLEPPQDGWEELADAREYQERRARWNNEQWLHPDGDGETPKGSAGHTRMRVRADDHHEPAHGPAPATLGTVGYWVLAIILMAATWVCARALAGQPIGVGGL
jgi:hypothetical protein